MQLPGREARPARGGHPPRRRCSPSRSSSRPRSRPPSRSHLLPGSGSAPSSHRARRPRIARAPPWPRRLLRDRPGADLAVPLLRAERFPVGPPYTADVFYSDLLELPRCPQRPRTSCSAPIYHGRLAHRGRRGATSGLPALAIVVLLARSRGRRPAAAASCSRRSSPSVLFALGPFLTVDGTRIGSFPGRSSSDLPGLEDVLTARFARRTSSLAAALIAASGSPRAGSLRCACSGSRRSRSWPSCPASEPPPGRAVPPARVRDLERLPRLPRPRREHPHASRDRTGHDDLWQAEADFRFRLAGGWLGEWFIPSALLATPGLAAAAPGPAARSHAGER